MNYLPVYIAKVVSTSGRNIQITTEWMSNNRVDVAPALDAVIKLPVPTKGDYVLILQADSSNLIRFYLPIRVEQPNVSTNPDNTEVDSTGETIIDGSTVYLGDGATEAGVLGDTLKDLLDDLITQTSTITVPTALGPSGPPINAAAITAISAQLITMLSTLVKTK